MLKINNTSTVTSKYALPDGSIKEQETTSNIATTENMTLSLLKEKTASQNYIQAGDEITVSLKLTNNSDQQITKVVITDTIGEGGGYKQGSLIVNDVALSSQDPTVGFTISEPISAGGGILTAVYTLVVSQSAESDISVVSEIKYTVLDEELTENSNEITLSFVQERLSIKKTANVSVAVSGAIVKFTNVISNEGKVKNTNVFFRDEIPSGATFVPESVSIDGVKQALFDPNVGFSLSDLDSGKTITVVFEVKVD